MTGSIGPLGTRPSYEMMVNCDTLLVIGSNFPYSQFLPGYEQARAVQIDHDPTMLGLRYPFEVNLVGDATSTRSPGSAGKPYRIASPVGG